MERSVKGSLHSRSPRSPPVLLLLSLRSDKFRHRDPTTNPHVSVAEVLFHLHAEEQELQLQDETTSSRSNSSSYYYSQYAEPSPLAVSASAPFSTNTWRSGLSGWRSQSLAAQQPQPSRF